jgi:hypothetical protein
MNGKKVNLKYQRIITNKDRGIGKYINKMKKIIIGIIGLLILSACASTSHCDAYGNKSAQVEINETHNS